MELLKVSMTQLLLLVVTLTCSSQDFVAQLWALATQPDSIIYELVTLLDHHPAYSSPSHALQSAVAQGCSDWLTIQPERPPMIR